MPITSISRNANISCTAPQNIRTYEPADASADVDVEVEGVRRGRWLYESSPWVDYFLACSPLPLQRESKGQFPSTLMCYMMEHNVTKEEPTEKFLGLNQECLRPTPNPNNCSRTIVLERLVNYGRGMAVVYFYFDDGFVKCSHTKDLIASLLLKPFSL